MNKITGLTRYIPLLLFGVVLAWFFLPSESVGLPQAGTALYATEEDAARAVQGEAFVSLIMPDVADEMVVVLPTSTTGVYSVRITGTENAGQYFWYNPEAAADNGDGFAIQNTLDAFGTEDLPQVPIVPILLGFVAFFITFRPIRKLLIRRQAPDSVDSVAQKVLTQDGFEIPRIDAEMPFRRATEPDAAAMYNAKGEGEVKRLASEQIQAVLRNVVQNSRLADVSRNLTAACRAIANGDRLPGLEIDFYKDLGIRPLSLFVTGVDFSVSQEQILQANAEASGKADFYNTLAELTGESVNNIMKWEAIREGRGGLLLSMDLPEELTGEDDQ